MKNLSRNCFSTLASLLALVTIQSSAAPLGTAFTYQGHLTDATNAPTGNYDVRFSLFPSSAAGLATATVTNLSVAVSGGLFTTTVDFGIGVFSGTAYWLELGTRTNGGGAFATLLPRQEVTPTPYALYAASSPLADGAVTSAKILDGTVATIDLATNAVTSAKILDGTIVGADLANNTITSTQLADNIDLGSSTVNGQLNIYRNAVGTPALILSGSDSTIRGYGNDGTARTELIASSTFGGVYLRTTNGNLRAYLLGNNFGSSLTLYQADGGVGLIADGDSNGSGRIELGNTNGSRRIYLYGQSPTSGSGGEISVNDNTGTETVELLGQATPTTGGKLTLKKDNNTFGISLEAEETDGRGGRLALYNSTGSFRAEIDGDDGDDGGGITLYTADGGYGVRLDGEDAGAGSISVYNTTGNTRLLLDGAGNGSAGQITAYTSDGSSGVNIYGDSGGAGLVYVYNTNSGVRVALDGYSTGAGGRVSVYDADGTETVQIIGAEDVNTGGQILMRNGAGGTTVQLDSDASGVGCGYLQLYKSDGTATITLQADLAGDGRITTQELQITGGSDLSEQFDINSFQDPLKAGMIVCIDPQNPGQLMTSTKSYDRTVAGVISGAGGVKPGMLMGQKGTKADGQHPVALTGRVYCWVDATHGAIEPGDLITTSDTPGHGMKVTDHAKAQGAIIGKAMTALPQGKGLVLMLVSLQ